MLNLLDMAPRLMFPNQNDTESGGVGMNARPIASLNAQRMENLSGLYSTAADCRYALIQTGVARVAYIGRRF